MSPLKSRSNAYIQSPNSKIGFKKVRINKKSRLYLPLMNCPHSKGLVMSHWASLRWLPVRWRGVPSQVAVLCSVKRGWQAQTGADLIRCQQPALSPDLPAGCKREQMGQPALSILVLQCCCCSPPERGPRPTLLFNSHKDAYLDL